MNLIEKWLICIGVSLHLTVLTIFLFEGTYDPVVYIGTGWGAFFAFYFLDLEKRIELEKDVGNVDGDKQPPTNL